MALEFKQDLKLMQKLVMTPQLQQAIKLLQLSRLELTDVIRSEMQENPTLEEVAEGAAPEEQKGDGEAKEPEGPEELKGEGDGIQEMDWAQYLESYSTPTTRVTYEDEDRQSFESTLTKQRSLIDHLEWQLRLSNMDDREMIVGANIIGNIDEDGYLQATVDEIASQCEEESDFVEAVLKKIQGFDPIGVAARTPQECLLIQVRKLEQATLDEIAAQYEEDPALVEEVLKKNEEIESGGSVVERILTDFIPLLEKKKFSAIAKELHISMEDVFAAIKIIAGLEPKPGRAFGGGETQYITPDIYIYKVGNDFEIVQNEDGLPKLRVSKYYQDILSDGSAATEATREYVKEKLRNAQWLINSINQRQRTIYKVTKSIIKFQREFLEKGLKCLRPLVLRDVAEDINMHESTISRVTTNKYVHTPQGIFELKFFFKSKVHSMNGQEISSESVKEKIRQIIANEDSNKPISDQAIVALLRRNDIDIARRTVAKYRENMKILPSTKRKKFY